MGLRSLAPHSKSAWAGVLALAFLTLFAASFLVGYSVWFLSTVSLVGLGAAAYTFNFHIPAAIIRLLALTRVGASLGERLWGHRLALTEQARHRLRHFRQAAQNHRLETQNWQLARGDALHGFMSAIEALEFRMLRVRIPALCLLILASVLLAVAALLSWPVALLLGLVFLSLGVLARHSYGQILTHTQAWTSLLEASGECLANLAFSARSLQGSGALDPALTAWHEQEQAVEQARQDISQAASWLERAIWLSGLGTAFCILWLMPKEPVLAAFLAFWTLAVLAAFAQVPNQLVASAAAKAARLSLMPQQVSQTLPPLPLNLDALGTELRQQPVCLIGPSGSGKTLTLKALAQSLSKEGLRVGLALHDAAILQMSWRANLDPYGKATDAQLLEVLEQVDLLDTCQERGGLDSLLEGQSALSSGQAHRLGLARILVGAFHLVLIDELGEHLAPDQRHLLTARIKAKLATTPLLITTHDPRVADQFDRVIEL